MPVVRPVALVAFAVPTLNPGTGRPFIQMAPRHRGGRPGTARRTHQYLASPRPLVQESRMEFATRTIHFNQPTDPATGAIVAPICWLVACVR